METGEIHTYFKVFCKIVIKSKSVKLRAVRAVNLITVVVAEEEHKQIISQCVIVLKSLTEQLSTEYQYLPSLGKVTPSLLLCTIIH